MVRMEFVVSSEMYRNWLEMFPAKIDCKFLLLQSTLIHREMSGSKRELSWC